MPNATENLGTDEIPSARFGPLRIGPRYLAAQPSDCVLLGATDVLVVGSGIAGLCAAIEAGRTGRVVLVAKGSLEESNTRYAQGGIAAAVGRGDDWKSHAEDTLRAGAGLAHADVVEWICERGPRAVAWLEEIGVRFDRENGGWALGREGGHQAHRIVHARGDATGRELVDVLEARVRKDPNIRVLERTFAVDLVTSEGRVWGAVLKAPGGPFAWLRSRSVVLATGGAGRIFRETTNPPVATGDGMAMAFRAGAELVDLEFTQFHPTTLYVPGLPRSLITEAVRGEGAHLVDRTGQRFLVGQHPLEELAPRDVVSRAIVRRVVETGDNCVYLDVRHLDAERFRRRFPGIARLLEEYGIDPTKELIPVQPAAHYVIGGVRARPTGETTLPGLFAVGEVAWTGFHGANRLASNSLLEGLVCGSEAGRLAAEVEDPEKRTARPDEGSIPDRPPPIGLDRRDLWNSLRALMWKRVGIERDAVSLQFAVERLEHWSERLFRIRFEEPADLELVNAMTTGRLMALFAERRLESRGCHFRRDHPEPRDEMRVDFVTRRSSP